ncbi:MAG: PqqD family protein [Deltaproteobacteria bacterium]|nr:PqqD family protein [Deltaproteobacteria bacterium]
MAGNQKTGKVKKAAAKAGNKGGALKKAIELDDIYCHSEDVVVRTIEDELILVPLVAGIGSVEGEIYALDETGREIWNRMDGRKTVSEIITDLEKTYQSSERSIQSDVRGLMGELATRMLIQRRTIA